MILVLLEVGERELLELHLFLLDCMAERVEAHQPRGLLQQGEEGQDEDLLEDELVEVGEVEGSEVAEELGVEDEHVLREVQLGESPQVGLVQVPQLALSVLEVDSRGVDCVELRQLLGFAHEDCVVDHEVVLQVDDVGAPLQHHVQLQVL